MPGVEPQPWLRALSEATMRGMEADIGLGHEAGQRLLMRLERERELALSQWEDLGFYEREYVRDLDRQIRRLRWSIAADTEIWPLYSKNALSE